MQIFNTMTRKKEDFIPQEPGVYRIYVCGPTVYNYIHIGNARPMIVFDTLRRYLEYQGNRVLFVSNITDIDDKIIAKANEDVPVKVLGAVVQQPISIVCALAEKNIKTPEDLIGKTIGYSGTRFGEVAVGQMLETVGATLDDVELIDVGFDLMSAMTTGNVDATFGCFINHEVPALEEEGFAVDYMEVMDYGVPNYYALMLVTGEDQLEANRDKYTRFLRACQKGFADMQADPEEALGLLLANQDEENFPLTASVERRSFDVLLPIMETADAPFLSQDVSVWQENIDWLQKVGMIDAAFDPAEVMVDLLAE